MIAIIKLTLVILIILVMIIIITFCVWGVYLITKVQDTGVGIRKELVIGKFKLVVEATAVDIDFNFSYNEK